MNLVVGATGPLGLGFEVCRELRSLGKPVRAIARPAASPARVEALRALGVELVSGDLKDRPSLEAACEGIATVVTTATSVMSRQAGDDLTTVDLEGQSTLVEAARAQKASHFIYVSFSGNMDPEQSGPLTVAKRTVERCVRESGMAYSVLRPSYFMQAWLSPAIGFDYPNAKAQIYGSGERPIGWISLYDVAKVAARCVDNPQARNVVVELGGPENLSPAEVVRIFEEVGGRPFVVQHVPEEALAAQGETSTDPAQQSFAALMLSYARGDSIDIGPMRQIFALAQTSVRDYATLAVSRQQVGAP